MIIFKFSAPTPKFSSLNWVLFRPNYRITHCYFQTSKGAEILKIELLIKSKCLTSSFCACVGNMLKREVSHWKVEIHVIRFVFTLYPRCHFHMLCMYAATCHCQRASGVKERSSYYLHQKCLSSNMGFVL